jgi:hypothetical protein
MIKEIRRCGNMFNKGICENLVEMEDKLIISSRGEARFKTPGYGFAKSIRR